MLLSCKSSSPQRPVLMMKSGLLGALRAIELLPLCLTDLYCLVPHLDMFLQCASMPPLSEGKQFYSPAPVPATAPSPRLQRERGEHVNDKVSRTERERQGGKGVGKRNADKKKKNKKRTKRWRRATWSECVNVCRGDEVGAESCAKQSPHGMYKK